MNQSTKEKNRKVIRKNGFKGNDLFLFERLEILDLMFYYLVFKISFVVKITENGKK